MTTPRQGLLQGRRAAAVVFGLFVAVGLVLVFGGTLTRSTDIEAKAEQARAEITALEARVAAGKGEILFFESDAFALQQARALGFGEEGEKLFTLAEDAPPPRAIIPLGSGAKDGVGAAPFDAWMELLFGV
ncbi:MAG: hypothetical protein U9O18_06880 [Chloroflexota bacterium]|nr:hypothetical protein [Chloroflexota bacterium]